MASNNLLLLQPYMPASFFLNVLLDQLDDVASRKTIAKGDFLIREGDTERNLYFIESGAVRAFLLSEHEEHTIRFGYEGSFINSISSYLTGKPSELYIEALRKTQVRIMPKEQMNEVVYGSEAYMKQYISLLEQQIVQMMERETDLLTISPQLRLERVLHRSPNLFQEVPLKYIASYLRMTPETLSRVRNS